MKTIVRTGTCNKKGCCCPEAQRLQKGGNCEYLLPPDANGKRLCAIRLDEEKGMTEEELKEKYGDYAIYYYFHFYPCSREAKFPQPEDFGYREETSDRKWADGWDAHLKEVMERFNVWKQKTGCTFNFGIVEV